MIRFTRSTMDGYVRIDGDGCAGLLKIEELRQLASHDTREELLALLNDNCPPTERNDR